MLILLLMLIRFDWFIYEENRLESLNIFFLQGRLTVCSVCTDAYHAKCHQPRIREKITSSSQWICVNCKTPGKVALEKIRSNINNFFS